MKRSFKTFPMSSGACLLTMLVSFMVAFSTAAADEVISIELNKTEETEQGCRPLFLFDNRSGHQLNKFQVEVVLFDGKGVYSRQILLDMAPLYKDKKVVASFLINDLACDEIGSMLVNALPSCANSAGTDLDCLALLDVTSKSSIPLEK
ncbi:MAG: hypothetical protein ACR2RF_13630 [Geminicoccaceae bacterium]